MFSKFHLSNLCFPPFFVLLELLLLFGFTIDIFPFENINNETVEKGFVLDFQISLLSAFHFKMLLPPLVPDFYPSKLVSVKTLKKNFPKVFYSHHVWWIVNRKLQPKLVMAMAQYGWRQRSLRSIRKIEKYAWKQKQILKNFPLLAKMVEGGFGHNDIQVLCCYHNQDF